MTIETLTFLAVGLAATPAALFLLNLRIYRPISNSNPPLPFGVSRSNPFNGSLVSVLIPARNEERNIQTTLSAVLANPDPDFEVIVLDDHSTDRTAEIVSQMALGDKRLRLE